MFKITKLLASLWFLMFLIPSTADSGTQQGGNACQMIERILADHGHLTIGIDTPRYSERFRPRGRHAIRF